MNTPVPVVPLGPLQRALLEALETVAAREPVRALLRAALDRAGIRAIPEDASAFQSFVAGALTITLAERLGEGAAEMVSEQVLHVVRLVAPAMRRQATGTEDDVDELSGERSVEAPSAGARASGAGPARPRPEVHRAPLPRSPASSQLSPLEAPVLFPPRSPPHESGTKRKAGAPLAGTRASSPTPPAGTIAQEQAGPASGARAVAAEVLVVTLDPRLVREVETRLSGRSRVSAVVTLAELMQHVGRLAGSRIAVVLDTGVPSIDLPTFASVASALPSRTHVVLWGTDERQKRRVVDMFPQARAWVASGSAESPIELLGEP